MYIDPAWDRAGYEQGKKLWLAHVKKPGAEAAIYRNAARFLEVGDKPLADQALLAGQKARPNEDWSMELSEHYTRVLLGSTIDMTLARQLVDWGEREAVARFLDQCARFNHRGKELAEWAAQIRKGINPDIAPYRQSGHYALQP